MTILLSSLVSIILLRMCMSAHKVWWVAKTEVNNSERSFPIRRAVIFPIKCVRWRKNYVSIESQLAVSLHLGLLQDNGMRETALPREWLLAAPVGS